MVETKQILKETRLRYSNDAKPGIQREPYRDNFRYRDPDGAIIRDQATIERLNKLGIPPAWTDVWICPYENGHILATGRDAKGRKQYRYHPNWQEHQAQTKYGLLLAFSECLPSIRAQTDAHLRTRGLTREKVLALVVRLLENTLIRIGSAEYARDNDHYGLTTLHDEHVAVNGSTIRFQFVGKSGKEHEIKLSDKRLARLVQASQDLDGQHLFQYLDDAGNPHPIGSGDVNAYLRELTGQDFTAKTFRTWGGSRLTLKFLADNPPDGMSEREIKSMLTAAVKHTASILGNTPTVCRKYYIHPAIMEAYPTGTLGALIAAQAKNSDDKYGLDAVERALIGVIQAG